MAYSDKEKKDIFDKICKEIESGKSLRQVLRENDNMPSTQTLYVWIDKDPEKSKQYARSCETRADIIFDEMIEIADDGTNDYMTKPIGDGIEVQVLNSEHIQRSRLRIDTRKWILSKMNPKKYGDKTDITTNGKDIKIGPYSDWTDEQISAEIKRLESTK